jgi:hypothetical protein
MVDQIEGDNMTANFFKWFSISFFGFSLLSLLMVANLSSCAKEPTINTTDRKIIDWQQMTIPSECVAKDIAGMSYHVILLCTDGRLFYDLN